MWTEQEARTKWCPESRTHVGTLEGIVAVNVWPIDGNGGRDLAMLNECRCIASDCMAWRWADKAGADAAGKPNYYPGHWKGYCGKAGRP